MIAIRSILAAIVASGLVFAANAQTKEQLVRGLTLPPPERGIEVQRAEAGVTPGQVDLYIGFDFNSDTLAADAFTLLNTLGDALKDPALAKARFLITGHTDATGSDAYNLNLSERRARAVAAYLVTVLGIDARRLTVEGKGEELLRDPSNPGSAANRRVEIRNLGQ